MSAETDVLILESLRQQVAATLAAGVVAGMGRTVSLDEIMAIKNDFYYSLYPNPSAGRYVHWKDGFKGGAQPYK